MATIYEYQRRQQANSFGDAAAAQNNPGVTPVSTAPPPVRGIPDAAGLTPGVPFTGGASGSWDAPKPPQAASLAQPAAAPPPSGPLTKALTATPANDITRVGNSYSGGSIAGPATINGQAPGGTTSGIDPYASGRTAPAPGNAFTRAAGITMGGTPATSPVPGGIAHALTTAQPAPTAAPAAAPAMGPVPGSLAAAVLGAGGAGASNAPWTNPMDQYDGMVHGGGAIIMGNGKELQNLATDASSIMNRVYDKKGRYLGMDPNSAATLAYRAAMDRQEQAAKDAAEAQRTGMQQAGATQRTGMEQSGAFNRTALEQQMADLRERAAARQRDAQLDIERSRLGIDQERLGVDAYKATQGQAGKAGEVSTAIRKEFEGLPEVKNYKQALPAYRGIIDAAQRSTPMSDINLVYGIAKLYDPNSVVREGEYATVAKAPGVPERIKGWAQYLAGGGKLTPEVKQQIVAEANSRMGTFDKEYGSVINRYGDIARRSGADDTLVVPQDYQPMQGQSTRTIARTGTHNGRRVVQYSDGSVDYAD
ncbi:MAG: hypothetical protein QM586_04950 [Xenophilus sp.]